MGKVTKKTSRKATPLQYDTKSGKKSSNRDDDNDVESLVLLNNPKERKKLDIIDERIKLLKTELKSLLGDVKTDKNLDSGPSENLDVKIQGVKTIEKCESFQETKQFKPNFNSTPSKTSEWLDKTIDEMNAKSQNEKISDNLLSNPPVDITTSVPEFTHSSLQLPQERIGQLLYKSFLLQNADLHLSSSENTESDPKRSVSTTKQQKYKNSRKQNKFYRGRYSNFSPYRNPGRVGRGRMPNLNNSQSDIEVIVLDSSSCSNKLTGSNTDCVELDVSNYDWSEPFDIEDETQSDVQVIEEKNNSINDKELQLNSPESGKNSHNDSTCIQGKKVWECPVCFEGSKGQEIVATQCGHVFCRKCLEQHMSKLSSVCPTCRSDLKNKPLITLFNF